ncbi:MAG: oligoendopeptidase F, partial [Vicinamibacterales bacterium]
MSAETMSSPASLTRTRTRADLPERFKWNVQDIFANWVDWEVAYKKLEAGIDLYAALKGTLGQGPEPLLKAFQLSEEMDQVAYRVWYYPSLQYDEDQRDNTLNARKQQV